MNEKDLLKALDMIASGSVDTFPPYRAAPREALMQYAAKIVRIYEKKLSQESLKNEQTKRNDSNTCRNPRRRSI